MLLHLEAFRFSFIAREAIYFPEGKSSNILRGAFGTIFRRIACLADCPGGRARSCPHRNYCPYAHLFEPGASNGGSLTGPSGLADWPRPFVFRAIHLDGQTFTPGQSFYFDFNLFDLARPAIPYLILSFAQLANDGLGHERRKVDLVTVAKLNERGAPSTLLFQNGSVFQTSNDIPPLALDLTPAPEAISRLRVQFLTPTELKSGQQFASRPEFAILASRARDRISTLRHLYGEGPLPIDFRGFGERAALVQMTRCDIRAVEIQRCSSRTGQIHPIGGFVGDAEYEGANLSEFLPYLTAAKWTGIGRQTVWGKGQIAAHF